MKLLITGANGFLGKALLSYIEEKNIFSRNNIWLLSSKQLDGYNCILHHDYSFSENEIVKAGLTQIDCLLHMGSSVPKIKEEFGTGCAYKFATNVTNTAYLMRHLPSVPRKVVYISSVSVYKNLPFISEDTELQIQDMYGASKLMCEAFLMEDSKKKNYELQILRLGQLYGEGEETYSKIVSAFVQTAFAGKPIRLFGTGNELRTMLYIQDCAKYIVDSLFLEHTYDIINITGSESISVSGIAETIFDSLRLEKNIVIDSSRSNDSITYDPSRMNRVFAFSQTPYSVGIKNYCDYFLKNMGVM